MSEDDDDDDSEDYVNFAESYADDLDGLGVHLGSIGQADILLHPFVLRGFALLLQQASARETNGGRTFSSLDALTAHGNRALLPNVNELVLVGKRTGGVQRLSKLILYLPMLHQLHTINLSCKFTESFTSFSFLD